MVHGRGGVADRHLERRGDDVAEDIGGAAAQDCVAYREGRAGRDCAGEAGWSLAAHAQIAPHDAGSRPEAAAGRSLPEHPGRGSRPLFAGLPGIEARRGIGERRIDGREERAIHGRQPGAGHKSGSGVIAPPGPAPVLALPQRVRGAERVHGLATAGRIDDEGRE